MAEGVLLDFMQHALWTAAWMVIVIMMPGLIIGFCISLLQAATQIQEQTLSTVPKLLVTFAALTLTGAWLGEQLIELTHTVFEILPEVVGL